MLDSIKNILPTDNPWLMIIIGIVALVIVIGIIKAMFKLVILAIIIGAVLVFGFGMTPEEVVDKGKELVQIGKEAVQNQVKPILLEQIETATYEEGENGAFTLKNTDFELTKSENGDVNVRILSLNLNFTWDELADMLTEEEMKQLNQMIEQKKAGN